MHVVRLPLISAVLVVVVPVVPLLSNSALYFADAASSQVCLSSGSNCANFILRIISTRTYISHRLVPEQIPFKHSCEGPDDMPAHAKVIIRLLFLMKEKKHLWSQACLLGSNLTLPICDGRVTLGTWQVSIRKPSSLSIPLTVSGSNLG